MKTFSVKNFNSRQELETEISKFVELSPNLKNDYEIRGAKKELSRLYLSGRTLFYGIKCVVEDESPSLKIEKPQRGVIFDSKLNGQTKIKNK